MRNKSEKEFDLILLESFMEGKKFQEVCKLHMPLDSNPKRIHKTGKSK